MDKGFSRVALPYPADFIPRQIGRARRNEYSRRASAQIISSNIDNIDRGLTAFKNRSRRKQRCPYIKRINIEYDYEAADHASRPKIFARRVNWPARIRFPYLSHRTIHRSRSAATAALSRTFSRSREIARSADLPLRFTRGFSYGAYRRNYTERYSARVSSANETAKKRARGTAGNPAEGKRIGYRDTYSYPGQRRARASDNARCAERIMRPRSQISLYRPERRGSDLAESFISRDLPLSFISSFVSFVFEMSFSFLCALEDLIAEGIE